MAEAEKDESKDLETVLRGLLGTTSDVNALGRVQAEADEKRKENDRKLLRLALKVLGVTNANAFGCLTGVMRDRVLLLCRDEIKTKERLKEVLAVSA